MRLPALAVASLVALPSTVAHTYTYKQGALPAGNDAVAPATLTLAAAEDKCNSLASCVGITFSSPSKVPANAVKTYFKNKLTAVNADPTYQVPSPSPLRRGWPPGLTAPSPPAQTYLRDYTPPPPPPTPGGGKLFLPKLFASNMVLQRAPARAHIWGWVRLRCRAAALTADCRLADCCSCRQAAPNEAVKISIGGQSASATAAANGSWSVLLAPRPATPSGAPALELKVSAPSGSFSLSNVVFGDLFLCGGQSNMAFATSQANNASAIIADSGSYPNLRLFTVANPRGSSSGAVALDVNVSTPYVWGVSNASTVRGPGFGWFSAVCYLYGRELYTALGGAVPIGLVASNVGGTAIQLWQSGDALAACAPKPSAPEDQPEVQLRGLAGGNLWNGMIAPLLPFAVRGTIWCELLALPNPTPQPTFCPAEGSFRQTKARRTTPTRSRTPASSGRSSKTGRPSSRFRPAFTSPSSS